MLGFFFKKRTLINNKILKNILKIKKKIDKNKTHSYQLNYEIKNFLINVISNIISPRFMEEDRVKLTFLSLLLNNFLKSFYILQKKKLK